MPFEIAPYSRYDRDKIAWLQEPGAYVHHHLDWRSLAAWLDDATSYAYTAYAGGQMAGCMLASAPYNGASWLRAVMARSDQNVGLLLDALWLPIRQALAASDAREVGVLLLNNWLVDYLPALGFRKVNEVVTLVREAPYLPLPLRADLLIRPVRPDDLEAVRVVDNAAFTPMWQYSIRDLRDALGAAVRFTVAEMNDRVVGYQLSTLYQDSVHLVRLATLPRLQGMGVGGMLLGETIEYFLKHKRKQMTVNTQVDNRASRQLYRRFGFVEMGYSVPVWGTAL
ncbi:MAG: GNAT family N-acetyltransferase [Anaerolineae bacterium]|nr:GNAT family N-acetyltransferase [Anaerolineae bacterium]